MRGLFCVMLKLVCFIQISHEHKILSVFPSTSQSHSVLGTILMKELVKRGHEVTMFSLYPLEKPMENYRDIVFKTDLFQIFYGDVPKNTFSVRPRKHLLAGALNLFEAGVRLTDAALNDENMQKLLKSNETFDAVIVDGYLVEALYTIALHFNAPLMVFNPIGPNLLMNKLVGNPNYYAYAPNIFAGYSDRMSFFQRMNNMFLNVFAEIVTNTLYYPKQEQIRAKYFPHLPDLYTLMQYNVSIILANSHYSTSYPQPLVPNFIEIGGFHLSNPKPLLDELRFFLDEAKDGAIYFSLGTTVRSFAMPEYMRMAITKTFSKLKQKVLWKWEDETLLPEISSNVKISKWFPQTDILAHPNIKLFVTHGGLGSLTESLARGVPIVGIPVFGDQVGNVQAAVRNGFGIGLELKNITYESFHWAVKEVLDNPKYTHTIKQSSQLFSDREIKPMDRAVYWIEYVTRHKGASHLRTAALDLNIFQYLLLDIVLFLTAIVAAIISFTILSIRVCQQYLKMVKNQHKNKE